MKSVDDLSVYDFKREGSATDHENRLEPISNAKNYENSGLYILESEELVSKSDYILNIAGFFRETDSKIACSLSDHQTAVYSLTNVKLEKINIFPTHESTISSTRFSHDKETHIFTSSLDGTVKLWDLRNHCQLAQTFSGGDSIRPITCFDISCDGRFICAGTEVIGGSAFLLFWDIRSTKLLGGYWESHVEDLTQVKFHPDRKSCMVTGGMDGLINIFDIKKPSEDDALIDSLNTEQSVEKLGWLDQEESLYCLTHLGDLQFWKLTDSSPYIQFTRQQISSVINMKYPDNLYSVDVHVDNDGNNILLAGSSLGNGDCLRSVIVNSSLSSPKSLTGNSQVVRCSVYDSQNDVLITAGEKGIINVWKPGKNSSNSVKKLKGHSQKNKSLRMKPY